MLKRLEGKKEDIRKQYEEGKIDQKEAEEITQKLDRRIARIKEFNSLPLPEKKERLSNKFKYHLEQNIKDGKVTKEEGEKILKDFNKSLENWDGKESPKFMHKHHKNNRN